VSESFTNTNPPGGKKEGVKGDERKKRRKLNPENPKNPTAVGHRIHKVRHRVTSKGTDKGI